MVLKNKQKKDLKTRNELKLLKQLTKKLKETNKIKYNYERAKEKQLIINRNKNKRKIINSVNSKRRKSSSKPKGIWGNLY